jgi:hypothetical protein
MDVNITTTADGSFVMSVPTFDLANQEDFLLASELTDQKLPQAMQEAAVHAAQVQPQQE